MPEVDERAGGAHGAEGASGNDVHLTLDLLYAVLGGERLDLLGRHHHGVAALYPRVDLLVRPHAFTLASECRSLKASPAGRVTIV